MNRVSRLVRLVLITLILSLSNLGYLHSAHAEILPIEREALIALYNSTDGDNWTDNSGWKTPPLDADDFAMPGTENTWYGIVCDAENTYVEGINLNSNELIGIMPTELMNLSSLLSVDICDNRLHATDPDLRDFLENLQPGWEDCQILIPPGERAALIALYNSTDGDNWTDNSGWKEPPLDTDGFAMWGTENTWYGITLWDANLYVKWIDLRSNELTGSLPSELGNINSLNGLWLRDNQLTGSIPSELGSLKILQYLYLNDNQLTGNIPPELGSSPPPATPDNLKYLYLNNNELTGSIPPELGSLPYLVVLSLEDNQLAGEIPTELTNLSWLALLYICNNSLYATDPALVYFLNNHAIGWEDCQALIPTGERAALIALYNSTDGDNWTDNSGWKEPPLDPDGFAMRSTENTWHGITCDAGNTHVQSINLNSNQLAGPLPAELGNLENLQDLLLYSNELTGSIPPELGNLANLSDLALYSNQLTGSIPPELGNLANLALLTLYSNQLTGSIPPELGNLTNLYGLWIEYNQLAGSIPSELGNLANLQFLYLDANELTGRIPTELTNLSNLSSLDICYNHLYATDPDLRDFLNDKQPEWEDCQTLIPTGERAALIALYNSTNGDNWTDNSGWKEPPLDTDGFAMWGTENTWHGITCDAGHTYVQKIDLYFNELVGVIPPELMNLSSLSSLNICDNHVEATDPDLRDFLDSLQPGWEDCQNPLPPELTVQPETRDVSSNAGSTTFDVSNSGGGELNWTATVITGNSWLSITSGSSGINAGTIYCDYTQNTGSQRTGVVHVEATPGGLQEDVQVIQDAPPALPAQLERSPSSLSPSCTEGENAISESFEVWNSGGGSMSYSIGENITWLWVGPTSGTSSGEVDTIDVYYNTSGLSTGSYNGTITITAPGAGNSPQIISVTLNVNPVPAEIPAIEREALIALYNSTDGDNWTDNSGWKTPPLDTDGFAMPGTENTWYGITLWDSNLYIKWIDLRSNELTGSIPPELGNLINLNGLWLHNNQLTGSIPSELGNPVTLQYLYLNNNQLIGNMPPELGSLVNLNYLYLDSNQLTGGIPPELGNLVYLTVLYLDSNQLTGKIPTELINLTSLSLLDICDNHLYATDPVLVYFLDTKQPGWEDCQATPYSRSMPWIPLLLLDD